MQTQRLRFDFNLPQGMTSEEVQKVEQLVNSWIQQDHSLATHVVPLQEAKDRGQHSLYLSTTRQGLHRLCMPPLNPSPLPSLSPPPPHLVLLGLELRQASYELLVCPVQHLK